MGILIQLLGEAQLGDPDETTDAENIERELYEKLRDRLNTTHDMPAIALKVILWERMKGKTLLDEQDIFLGSWLIQIDHSKETLKLIAKWFRGTSLEATVDTILG